MDLHELASLAIQARVNSYSPYSHFEVGAALLCGNEKIYTGCNVESVTYSPTNCAERTAFYKAVSEGERVFTAIAIAGAKSGEPLSYCYPCGVCRQVMAEFVNPEDFTIIVVKSSCDFLTFSLADLLPHSFRAESI